MGPPDTLNGLGERTRDPVKLRRSFLDQLDRESLTFLRDFRLDSIAGIRSSGDFGLTRELQLDLLARRRGDRIGFINHFERVFSPSILRHVELSFDRRDLPCDSGWRWRS